VGGRSRIDTLALMGSALGLSLASGLSLYGAAFLTGLAIDLGWVRLAPQFEALRVLGEPIVLLVAGGLFFVEFFADKIPWLDSAWDAVHTVIRPIGGALLAVRVFGDLNPAAEVVALLLLGGVTLATHGAKASLRLTANASPEPFSNWLLSFTENGLVVGIVWLALSHPIVALVVGLAGLTLALILVVWLGRRAVLAVRGFRARARARFPAGPGRLG
jgi:Domain of unknown function (DUF4126)